MDEKDIRMIFAKPKKRRKRVKRARISQQLRDRILEKTDGTCHVCGNKLGADWQVDHVVPHARAGKPSPNNYLPICPECNRLRWDYPPRMIPLIIRFGIIAKKAIRDHTDLGQQLIDLALDREHQNKKRRRHPAKHEE